MLSVRDAFDVLAKGLSLYGIELDNETFRQLKLKNPKSFDPVFRWTRKVVAVFGEATSDQPPASFEELCQRLGVSLSPEVPREINLLLLFGFVISEFNVFERIDYEQKQAVMELLMPPEPEKDDSPMPVLPQFSSKSDIAMGLVQAIKATQRKIRNLEKQKTRKLRRVCELHGIQNWSFDLPQEVSADRLQKVVLYFEAVAAHPHYRLGFYTWFCQIFTDFYGPLPKKRAPLEEQTDKFLTQKCEKSLIFLAQKRKLMKRYLTVCKENGRPDLGCVDPKIFAVLEAAEANDPVSVNDLTSLLRVTIPSSEFEALQIRIECDRILATFMDTFEPGAIKLMPF